MCSFDAQFKCSKTRSGNRVSFEAGGNAPFIVFNDADVDAAVEGRSFLLFSVTLSLYLIHILSRLIKVLLHANSEEAVKLAFVPIEFTFNLPSMPISRPNSQPRWQLSESATD